MPWIKDLEVGSTILVDTQDEKSQHVEIKVLYKRGRLCRLSIDAPRSVNLQVAPAPQSVKLVHNS